MNAKGSLSNMRRRIAVSIGYLVVVVVGSAAGVYVGFAWQGDSAGLPVSAMGSDKMFPAEQQLVVGAGDRLPSIDVMREDGSHTTSDSLFKSDATVLLIWSPECGSCYDEADLWERTLQPRIKPGAIAYVCLDQRFFDGFSRDLRLVGNRKVLFLDYKDLKAKVNLSMTPIIIALDSERFIMHVDYGSHGGFDRELVDFLVGGI